MAQLTDDCFAFSGPLMPVAEVERIIAERVSPVARRGCPYFHWRADA
jgi:molybdopterin molybdotransferase